MAKPSTKTKSTSKRRRRKVASAPAPEVTATEGTTEAAAPEPATAPAEPRRASAADEPSAEAEIVRIGPVEGRIQRVSVGIVQGLLGSELRKRVEVLQRQPSIEPVRERMRATDGRATPVYFAAGSAENDPPTLISGVEAVAAALDLGVDHIFVILIPRGDVGAAQSHIVAMAQKPQQPEDSEDDLYVRVLLDDE